MVPVEIVPLIRATEARATFGVAGEGVSIAVVDTGIRADHVDFGGRVRAGVDFSVAGARGLDGAVDRNGHGTHLAGIIAANGLHRGVAPAASIVAVKAFGAGLADFDGNVADALEWVADHARGLDIVAVCLASTDRLNHGNDSALRHRRLTDAISRLCAARIAAVVPSGNHYARYRTQGMTFPAILRETISVGAVFGASEGGIVFPGGGRAESSAPDRLLPMSQRLHESMGAGPSTTVFAPGGTMESAWHGDERSRASRSGTSQAAAVTCGIVALLQQLSLRKSGSLAPVEQIKEWLRTGAVPVLDGDDHDDNVPHTGETFRRVDAANALAACAASPWLDRQG